MKRDYEFYIYGAQGASTLVMHSVHFNDVAAIRRARDFAGGRAFEVWCDNDAGELQKSFASTLIFRSSNVPSARRRFEFASQARGDDNRTNKYEFRLRSPAHGILLFAGVFANDDQASDHGRKLLHRHTEMVYAEVWRGMKLIRQI